MSTGGELIRLGWGEKSMGAGLTTSSGAGAAWFFRYSQKARPPSAAQIQIELLACACAISILSSAGGTPVLHPLRFQGHADWIVISFEQSKQCLSRYHHRHVTQDQLHRLVLVNADGVLAAVAGCRGSP